MLVNILSFRRSVQAVLARPGQDEAVAILFVKHDNSYKTVAFGETVIKEMFFSSMYPNVRISRETSMVAYQVWPLTNFFSCFLFVKNH